MLPFVDDDWRTPISLRVLSIPATPNQRLVLLTILLLVDHKDIVLPAGATWGELTVKRWSWPITLRELSKVTGLTVDEVRRALDTWRNRGQIETRLIYGMGATNGTTRRVTLITLLSPELLLSIPPKKTRGTTKDVTKGRPRADLTYVETQEPQDCEDYLKMKSKTGAAVALPLRSLSKDSPELDSLVKDSLRRLGYSRPGLTVLRKAREKAWERITRDDYSLDELRWVVSWAVKRLESFSGDTGQFSNLPQLWSDSLMAIEVRREAAETHEELDHESAVEPW